MRRLIAAGFCVAAFALVHPSVSFAQVEQVRIDVNGLTCNLCAAGLERSLRQVAGVSNVEIVFEHGPCPCPRPTHGSGAIRRGSGFKVVSDQAQIGAQFM